MDERREHTRIKVTMAVRLSGDLAEVIWANMEDLSAGGAFIRTSRRLTVGVPVDVVVLEDDNPGVALAGVVCRVTERGVALQWGELGVRERALLERVLASGPGSGPESTGG